MSTQVEFDFDAVTSAARPSRSLSGEEREKLIGRLKKLLRLGNGSDNQREAELALARAQELAQQYQIDLAALSPEACEIEILCRRIRLSRSGTIESLTGSILTTHFEVSCIWHKDLDVEAFRREMEVRYTQAVSLIGTEMDVTVAQYVLEFVIKTARKLVAEYKAGEKAARRKVTKRKTAGFVDGFFNGLHWRLKMDRQEQSKLLPAATATALVTTRALVNSQRANYVRERFPNLESVKIRNAKKDSRAQETGFEQGARTAIRTALGSGGITPNQLEG